MAKKRALTLTLNLNTYQHPHNFFLDHCDEKQDLYEKARKAIIDRRCRINEQVLNVIQAHGVAGLFINPESTLVAGCSTAPYSYPQKRNTALHHTRLSDKEFATIARSLAEGVGVRTTGRIQQVDKKTVLLVLKKAGEHAVKVSRALLKNITVQECQLDEMWSFVGKKEKNLNPLEKLQGIMGDAWIWIAFDAVNKIVVASVVGKRTLPHAVSLLEEVQRVTAEMPQLFSSDQLDQYKKALLHVYGVTFHPPQGPGPGRPPGPRLVPPDNLLYVQVVKQYKKYRVIGVSRKIIFGDPGRIEDILAASPVSRKINTSYVERNNGIIRHNDARCVRKTLCFSKLEGNHKCQLDLSLGYYHLCNPHGTLSKRHGGPTTPFMAAGITDHVWSMEELLKAEA